VPNNYFKTLITTDTEDTPDTEDTTDTVDTIDTEDTTVTEDTPDTEDTMDTAYYLTMPLYVTQEFNHLGYTLHLPSTLVRAAIGVHWCILLVLMLRPGCMSSSKENVTAAWVGIRWSRSWSEPLESLLESL